MSWFEREKQVNKESLFYPSRFVEARSKLDQLILEGLSGNQPVELVVQLAEKGFLDYSRIRHALVYGDSFDINIFLAINHTVNTGKKNRKSLPFPSPELLGSSGMDRFLTDLTTEGARKTIICCQMIVEGSLYDAEEGNLEYFWIPTSQLVKRGLVLNTKTWKQAVAGFKNGDLSLENAEEYIISANTRKIARMVHPILKDII